MRACYPACRETPILSELSAVPNDPPPGAQALSRGLSVVDAVARGHSSLAAIAGSTGCTRSTTQRLASTLVRAGWLTQDRTGYALGPRLAELGTLARERMPLARLARPTLEALADETADTVHLGVRDGTHVVYADKIDGRRGLQMRSRAGQSMSLAFTGVGRALMLDMPPDAWRPLYDAALSVRPAEAGEPPSWTGWQRRMAAYVRDGVVLDLEDNELGIRCVAAPVRNRDNRIVAAISVASASPYMPDERLRVLGPAVQAAARRISGGLGWVAREEGNENR